MTRYFGLYIPSSRLWPYIRLAPEFSTFNHTWVDDESCNGRSLYDTMPWKDLLNEGNDKFYTNADLYELFDPTNPSLPYVYEHFDWEQCTPYVENYTATGKIW